MAKVTPLHGIALPSAAGAGLLLVRPLLDIPKARLIATLARERHPVRGRSVEPRSALHARSRARPDAGARARGARSATPRAAGAAAAPRRGRDRDGGRCRGGRAQRANLGRSAGRSSSMPKNSAACPPKWRCACWAGRLRAPATRGRSISASSRRCMRRMASARDPATFRLRRSLAGALVTHAGAGSWSNGPRRARGKA